MANENETKMEETLEGTTLFNVPFPKKLDAASTGVPQADVAHHRQVSLSGQLSALLRPG